MPQIHPETVTLAADWRAIEPKYRAAAREWTSKIHEQDGTLKLAQVLAMIDDRPTVSSDTVQRLRDAARRLRLDYIGTGAHDTEATEIDALADWLEMNGGTR
jgi:hypothetical protein